MMRVSTFFAHSAPGQTHVGPGPRTPTAFPKRKMTSRSYSFTSFIPEKPASAIAPSPSTISNILLSKNREAKDTVPARTVIVTGGRALALRPPSRFFVAKGARSPASLPAFKRGVGNGLDLEFNPFFANGK